MEWQLYVSDARSALAARPALSTFLRATCTAGSDCDSAEIIFGELVANVARHSPGWIEITVRSEADGSVTIDVCDGGKAFELRPSRPSDFSERGRGLSIVGQLSRRLTVANIESGNKVTAVLPVVAKRSVVHLVPDAHDAGVLDARAVEHRPS